MASPIRLTFSAEQTERDAHKASVSLNALYQIDLVVYMVRANTRSRAHTNKAGIYVYCAKLLVYSRGRVHHDAQREHALRSGCIINFHFDRNHRRPSAGDLYIKAAAAGARNRER